MQITDWLADLGCFPAHVVATACQQWRQTQSRRPTIADIRALCPDTTPYIPPVVQGEATCTRADVEAQQQRYAEAEAWRQKFAEDHGFTSFAEVMQVGIQNVMRMAAR